jgi:hypothetical protein
MYRSQYRATGKDLEGGGSGLIEVLSRYYTGGTKDNHENPVKVLFWAKIRTEHLTNRNLEHYRCVSLLDVGFMCCILFPRAGKITRTNETLEICGSLTMALNLLIVKLLAV